MTDSVIRNNPALDLSSLRWLLLSQIVVLLPHIERLPIWLLVLSVALTTWRWIAFYGIRSLPPAWARSLLVILSIAVFVAQYRGQFTVEAAVAFLALTYALKILEVMTRRDLYLFVFLSSFLLAMLFLFDQSLWSALYVIAATLICLVTLAVNQATYYRRALRQTMAIFLQALPLVLIAYLLFPRIAPLWSVPLKSSKAWTGITDVVRPGDIAELAQSDERAFRVRFDGKMPAQDELYWRGLILDFYQNNQWRRSSSERWLDYGRAYKQRAPNTPGNGEVQYEIIQEASGKRWGFALAGSRKGSGDYELNADGLVRFRQDLLQPVRYSLVLDAVPAAEADAAELRRDRLLPRLENPQTRAWAETLRNQQGSDAAVINAMLRYFREQPFYYTLKPPVLSGQQIDGFMFQSRRGFCAHYASAFTFALRAAGIPARMVVGYQGGEWNPDGGYLMIRQYDAHAWTEAWLPERGWVRFDPTAMVAPDRISRGLREAMSKEGSFLENSVLSLNRYADVGVVQWLRLRLDEVNYNWQRWVVQYDEASQLQLFQRWYSGVNLRTLGLWLVGILVGGMLLLLLWLLAQERIREPDPVKRLVRRFIKVLGRSGVERRPGETIGSYGSRVAQGVPLNAQQILHIARELEQWLYAKADGKPERRQMMDLKLRILKLGRGF